MRRLLDARLVAPVLSSRVVSAQVAQAMHALRAALSPAHASPHPPPPPLLPSPAPTTPAEASAALRRAAAEKILSLLGPPPPPPRPAPAPPSAAAHSAPRSWANRLATQLRAAYTGAHDADAQAAVVERTLLDPLAADPYLTKHLLYALLEAVLGRVFPELAYVSPEQDAIASKKGGGS